MLAFRCSELKIFQLLAVFFCRQKKNYTKLQCLEISIENTSISAVF
jgi:hypothetical protein